jgi:poly(3-hydroxybutyrate) depolymerase
MGSLSTWKSGLVTALVAASLITSTHAQAPQPAGGPPAAGAPARAGQPGGRGAVDPRVQQRTYTFKDTGEALPYAVFVSSKVTRDKKAPLIVALHGLGGDQNTMLRGNALQLAEEGGYILVGPMGYNSSGWFGAPSSMAAGAGGASGGVGMGGPPRGGPGGPPPGAGPGAGPGRGSPPTILAASNETSQKSEKDVMTVLEMIRKEFNVDENRTYLMGHSMGGAGAIYLGVKHASNWAAIAAIAPATQPAGINPVNYSLAPAKSVPMIVVQGDMDPLIPHLTSTRPWIEQMKELGIAHKYIEEVGGDHGTVITSGMPEIFTFFAQHSRVRH